MQEIKPPFNIHLHSRRHRLADADGLCAKWVIDSFVENGLFEDDSPGIINEVTFSQEKISPSELETVTVIIREV